MWRSTCDEPVTPQLRVIEVSGGPQERGRAHGEEARELIHDVIGRWHDDIALDVGERVDSYFEEFLDTTDFRTAIRRWTPDLLEEVTGVAEGAGLSEPACTAWQLLDEEWWYRERYVARRVDAAEHCSAAGGSASDGHRIIGQNMDIEAYHDGSQVLLHSRATGAVPESLVVTTAGMIGLTGLNRAGVGVCVNSLPELAPSPTGLPVAFVIRGVLACSTLGAAAEFLHSVAHASGQNYLVGSPSGIVDVECSAGRAQELDTRAGRVVHTNHHLANDDLATDRPSIATATHRSRRPPSTTRERFELLAERLLDDSEPFSVERLRDALCDRSTPVSVVPSGVGDFMTFASVVMDLSDEPVLHVAPGPPDHTSFETHTFE